MDKTVLFEKVECICKLPNAENQRELLHTNWELESPQLDRGPENAKIWVPDPRPEKTSPRIPVPIFCPEHAVTVEDPRTHSAIFPDTVEVVAIAFFSQVGRKEAAAACISWRPCQGPDVEADFPTQSQPSPGCKSWLPA